MLPTRNFTAIIPLLRVLFFSLATLGLFVCFILPLLRHLRRPTCLLPAAACLQIGEAEANLLADHGCTVVVEGANMPTAPAASKVFKKRGVSFAPYKATLAVGTVASGAALAHAPLATADALDAALATRADEVFKLCKETAKEFNSRGDLAAGAQIAAFIRVAEVMERHGAV